MKNFFKWLASLVIAMFVVILLDISTPFISGMIGELLNLEELEVNVFAGIVMVLLTSEIYNKWKTHDH
jgi:hypothetical protein